MGKDPADRSRQMIISPPASLLEVDEHATSSNDSFLLDSASITSSITQWEWENGRRYHAYKAGSYAFPNDEQELDRIDLKHHVMMLLCDGHLHLAPLHKPGRILDVGTGTGIWALQMAEQYPGATIWGTDLSPIQPSLVPDNVRFEIDDCNAEDWSWPDNYFDYIHSRFMLSSIGSWSRFVRQAFQHIKPGGYFEMQELDPRFRSDDGSLREDSTLAYWSRTICEASASYNRSCPQYDQFIKWFEKAGFVDVKRIYIKSPSNPWPKDRTLKEVGKFQLVAHLEGLEGLSVGLLTRQLEWKPEEVKILIAKIRPELKDRSIHSYQMNAVIVGRKPEIPQHYDPSSHATSKSQAPLTPNSFSAGSPGPFVSEFPKEGRAMTGSSGGSSLDQGFTPTIDIPLAPANKNLQDPSTNKSSRRGP